jgi:MFS family permease
VLQTLLLPALLAGHSFASMAVLVLPAVAPEVARDYGFDPSLIGYQISLVSSGMVVTLTLLGNTSRRLGAARTNQFGHALVASGMLVLLIPSSVFLVIGSLVIGLGYGMITPSASHLLMRYTPPQRRSTVFSIHQVGIPAGGMLAALIAPAVAIIAGWRWAVIMIALFTALATPAADIVSMFILAIPMIALYFMAWTIAWFNDRRVARKNARLSQSAES